MARFIRPQFSLATLLIAMAWSGVVVWINIKPHAIVARRLTQLAPTEEFFLEAECGCPFCHLTKIGISSSPDRFEAGFTDVSWHYWALAADVAVGVLLVVVLAWASSQLLRRVTSRRRRRRIPPRSTS